VTSGTRASGRPATPWWRRGALYEIYVRSFQDSDGDGVGDLEGIRRRLPYLEWLGVAGIWLTPFYRSPMADFGYDISDHTDVDPRFGSLETFDALVADAHARGIRVVVDYVPNHTSDQHPWFVASRSSRDDPKRDWYVWRDPKPDGSPPNNWLSLFGGSAWETDPATGQAYLHTFLREQPDLDWRNPEVREAMFDVARFWLDRGVDGFRIDVAGAVMKDPELLDNAPNPHPPARAIFGDEWARWEHHRQFAWPDVYDVWKAFREVVDEYADHAEKVTIAEVSSEDLKTWAKYYGTSLDAIHMPFGFHLLHVGWDAATLRTVIGQVEAALPDGAWPNWVLGNHDQPRIANRAGPERSRVATMLLLTLRGAPTMYYGDELGMTDGVIPPDRLQDPWEARVAGLGRDPARTPMRWDASPNGGFTPEGVEPWLPLSNGSGVDVASQQADPASMLHLTRDLLALRRDHRALAEGTYRSLDAPAGVLLFLRECDEERIAVVLAVDGTGAEVPLPGSGRILRGTHTDRAGERVAERVRVEPFEGVVVLLD
jgi:alpha-glucosidase